MTKVIDIVVIGATGAGKSHVLGLIDRALRSEYGHHVQIASHDLSCERGLGSPGDKPCVSDTIFNLRERGTSSGGGQSLAGLKIEVDTSEVDAALEKVEALGKAFWESQLSSGTVSLEALQGVTTGYATNPLESAISSTLSAIRDERESGSGLSPSDGVNRDATLSILGAHLIRLLELQVTQLNEPTVVEHSQVGDVTHTEITTGRR